VATRANQRTKVVHSAGDLPAILEEIENAPPKPKSVKWLENAASLERWDAQHHASLSAEVEERLNRKDNSDLRVSEVAELVDERADPRRWGTQKFNYIEISDIDPQTCVVYSNCVDIKATPSRARKLVRAGDVLVSTVRPERGTVGVVGPHQDGSICTTGLAVLRAARIDPLTLARLLKTEFVITQLMRNNVGIAYPAINESCLPDVLLPARREDLSRLDEQARAISAAEERLRQVRSRFATAIDDAGTAWRQNTVTSTSTPHPASQTTSRRQSRKPGSDSRDLDIFQRAGAHTP
jgi:type I restriction enzyme S subunit